VAKARAKAARAKAALDEEKALRDEARAAAAAAENDLAAAQVRGETALVELQEATESAERAALQVEALRLGPTVEGSIIPTAPTEEELAVASAVEQSAQEELDAAVATGAEALVALATAEQDLVAATAEAAMSTATVTRARADHQQAKEKVAVYRESLAKTRQPPVAAGSYRLTARFGQTGGYWSGGIHTGLDFAGSTGTDITAAASGTVVEMGYAGAYGNRIVIDHGKGVRTAYNHLSAIRVKVGQKVRTGDHIGDMGATGNTTGTHLHFEVTRDDAFLDPETWLGW
jgi:murein DD-endopeptidase MepM/ murein hydrolase activator NlpD